MRSERSAEMVLVVLLCLLLIIVIVDLLLPLIRKHSRTPAGMKLERSATSLVCGQPPAELTLPGFTNSYLLDSSPTTLRICISDSSRPASRSMSFDKGTKMRQSAIALICHRPINSAEHQALMRATKA